MRKPFYLRIIPGKKSFKDLYSDMSLLALIGSNLLVILWALIVDWSLGDVMYVYWSQSVCIGILWFFKILALKEFSTQGMEANGRPVKANAVTKIASALFFLVHYGIFHFAYLLFIREFFKSVDFVMILPLALLFFIYQCYSYFYNKKWKPKKKPNLGEMMFFPYTRIFPMHITIVAGGFLQEELGITFLSKITLLLFMLLKTYADILMHEKERRGTAY